MPMDPDDDVFLGALPPYALSGLPPYQLGAGRRRRAGRPLRDNAMRWASPYRPGIQATDGALLPISFAPFAFTNALGTNSITQVANPQTPFRGQRISAQVLRNGASASATAPVLQQLLVGPKPIILTTPGPALETFGASAYDTNLILPPTYPGMQYAMTVSLQNALAANETLTALVSIIGTSII